MTNIKNQNNTRMNLSSFSKIYKLENHITFNSSNVELINSNKLNNNKLININNFKLSFGKKKISYSTYYTNPFKVKKNISNKIKFDTNLNNSQLKTICKKILLNRDYKLIDLDKKYLFNLVRKKTSTSTLGYIGLEKSFLILWYLVWDSKYVGEKEKLIYFDLIEYYYIQYLIEIIDFNEIIHKMISTNNLVYKKFYIQLYILAEEFHFKYIGEYLNKYTNNSTCKINFNQNEIFSSNYIKINPQSILSNLENNFVYDIDAILDEISNPMGHNILLIKPKLINKIYYYDPDEQIQSDLYKFIFLFKHLGIIFLNISNRNPIQTITDDACCVFYCMGFIKYLLNNNLGNNLFLEMSRLKKYVLFYETFLLESNINIYNWVCYY